MELRREANLQLKGQVSLTGFIITPPLMSGGVPGGLGVLAAPGLVQVSGDVALQLRLLELMVVSASRDPDKRQRMAPAQAGQAHCQLTGRPTPHCITSHAHCSLPKCDCSMSVDGLSGGWQQTAAAGSLT
jgi:hypothetical protein